MLTQKRLKEVLYYDPETGIFTWLVTRGKATKGHVAGSIEDIGYVQIGIDRTIYRAHRLAWLYMTGKFPKDQTDHVNMVRDDNRWENLREANRSQNYANRFENRNNDSGYRGVYYKKSNKKWCAIIQCNKAHKYLGLFSTPEEAAVAYQSAAAKLFGEFARLP